MKSDKALVVIDVQRVMFETPGEVLFEGGRVLKTIGRLIQRARVANVPVVYIQHTTAGAGSEFEKDSLGWQVHPDIAPLEEDVVSTKMTYDSFHETELEAKLAALGVKTLIVCGLQTEVCVDTTVRSMLAHGYRTYLVGDGHSSYDNGVLAAADIVAHHNTVLDGRFCTVVSSDDVEF